MGVKVQISRVGSGTVGHKHWIGAAHVECGASKRGGYVAPSDSVKKACRACFGTDDILAARAAVEAGMEAGNEVAEIAEHTPDSDEPIMSERAAEMILELATFDLFAPVLAEVGDRSGDAQITGHVWPATVQTADIRKPIRACLARRKRKASKRARARVGGGW